MGCHIVSVKGDVVFCKGRGDGGLICGQINYMTWSLLCRTRNEFEVFKFIKFSSFTLEFVKSTSLDLTGNLNVINNCIYQKKHLGLVKTYVSILSNKIQSKQAFINC